MHRPVRPRIFSAPNECKQVSSYIDCRALLAVLACWPVGGSAVFTVCGLAFAANTGRRAAVTALICETKVSSISFCCQRISPACQSAGASFHFCCCPCIAGVYGRSGCRLFHHACDCGSVSVLRHGLLNDEVADLVVMFSDRCLPDVLLHCWFMLAARLFHPLVQPAIVCCIASIPVLHQRRLPHQALQQKGLGKRNMRIHGNCTAPAKSASSLTRSPEIIGGAFLPASPHYDRTRAESRQSAAEMTWRCSNGSSRLG